jgi:hypothetical protein
VIGDAPGDAAGLTRRGAMLLIAIVLALRVGIAAQFARSGGNYDSESFRIVADLALSGQNFYAATERYNYSPFWAGIVAGLWAVARPDFHLFVLLIGLLQTAVDAASARLVFRIAGRLGRADGEARRAALLFFANPDSVLASSAVRPE